MSKETVDAAVAKGIAYINQNNVAVSGKELQRLFAPDGLIPLFMRKLDLRFKDGLIRRSASHGLPYIRDSGHAYAPRSFNWAAARAAASAKGQYTQPARKSTIRSIMDAPTYVPQQHVPARRGANDFCNIKSHGLRC